MKIKLPKLEFISVLKLSDLNYFSFERKLKVKIDDFDNVNEIESYIDPKKIISLEIGKIKESSNYHFY